MTIADKGARAGNFLVDFILIFLLWLIQVVIINLLFTSIAYDIPDFFRMYFFVCYFLYYFITEYFFGKTPGKYFSKTIVVNRLGKKPNFKAVFIRSIFRLTFHDQFSFVFGQGLHDSISGTKVVNNSRK